MKPTEPKTFKISTLRDIFNLPTMEQMQTCLAELAEAMLQARAASDMMLAMMKSKDIEALRAVEWPEVATWTDDGEGRVVTRLGEKPGKPMFQITTTLGGEAAPLNGLN